MISGNKSGGLKSAGSITIEGNYVGTDATGNVALGNGTPAPAESITGQDVGGAPVLSTTISNNVVSGNSSGISVTVGSQGSQSTYHDREQPDRDQCRRDRGAGNGSAGLQLESVENATVLDNVISANTVGVQLSGSGTSVEHNVIQGNLIGTDKTGPVALGNTGWESSSRAAIGNTIGGTGPGQGNVIAFNGGDGIDVPGASKTSSHRTRSSETRARASA